LNPSRVSLQCNRLGYRAFDPAANLMCAPVLRIAIMRGEKSAPPHAMASGKAFMADAGFNHPLRIVNKP
jgi:hypothetical protein